MQKSYLPESLGSILESFRGAFTAPSHANFQYLICGWLLCSGRHTVSRVIQAAGGQAGQRQHASIYRFFSRARWKPDDLGRLLLGLLLPYLPRVVEVVVDDTLCKRSGPQIFGIAAHHDGSASGRGPHIAFGHNWVVLALWVPLPWTPGGGVAVPLAMRLYRGRKGCPKELYQKRSALARELLVLVAGWLPATHDLSLVGDSEYACGTIVRGLPKDCHFTGPMVMDAALHAEPVARRRGQVGRPAKKGKRLPSPMQLAAQEGGRWRKIKIHIYGRRVTLLLKTVVCLWPTVAGTQLVRVVVTRDPAGRLADRAYFSTDTKLSAQEIVTRYAHRWEIEVSFRSAKQSLGVADPKNGWWRRGRAERRDERRPGIEPNGTIGQHAVERTAPMAFLVQGIVTVWYLRHGDPKSDVRAMRRLAPWYGHKRHPSFADMLGALRVALGRHRVSQHPLPEGVRQNLEELLDRVWRTAA